MIASSRVSPGSALCERIEHDEHRAEVRAVGRQQHRYPGDGRRVRHAGRLAGDRFDEGESVAGPLDRRGVGQLHVDDQPPLVLLRDESARGTLEDLVRQEQHSGIGEQDDALPRSRWLTTRV